MSAPKILVSGMMLALLTAVNAQAQVSIDVSKISCDQFTLYKITDPRNIAIWLSGYYNGKRDNTTIDTQVFNENYNKLRTYCSANPTLTVMKAAETLFGPAR